MIDERTYSIAVRKAFAGTLARLQLFKSIERGTPPPSVALFAYGAVDALDERNKDVEKKARSSVDREVGSVAFQISGPNQDRMGDIMIPQGMNNKNFRKNPVVLWAHDDSRLPIGRSLREEVVKDVGVFSDALIDIKNDPTGFNKAVLGMLADGTLSATSIRFMPVEFEKVMAKEAGVDVWRGAFKYVKWELLEFSVTPIPMYPDALALSLDGREAEPSSSNAPDGESAPMSPPEYAAAVAEVKSFAGVIEAELLLDDIAAMLRRR